MPEDRVQVPSFRKDGTPDQTDNFEIIGDKDVAKEAIATSLAQNKTAAAGEVRAQAAAAEGEAELSPEEQARQDEVDAAVADAESEADSLVESRWVDPASRQAEPEKATRRSRRSATEE